MRKRALSILLAVLLLPALAGCSQEPKSDVKFYTTELSTTYFGTSTTRTVYEYSEDFTQYTMTNWQDDELLSTVNYEVTETGYIARGTQDGVEEIMEVKGTKDEAGNPIYSEQYNNDELTSTTECTYDGNGNMLTFVSNTLSVGVVIRQEFTYDENGNKIKQINDYNGSITTTEYEYDSQSRLVRECSPDSSGWKEYEYSDGGKTQTAFAYDENGALSAKIIETYDDWGNLLTRQSYDESGALVIDMAYSYLGTDGTVSSGIKG